MISDVLVFEGQGARTVPGDPPLELAALDPADAQQAIVRYQLVRAAAQLASVGSSFAVLGQSLGEVSALVVAGSLAADDALELVRLRAELPAKLLPAREWTMASMTRLAPSTASAAARGLDLWVIGHNGPADCIVVGDTADFAGFVGRVGASPNTYRQLPVAAPYHTPAMQPVADEVAAVVDGLTIGAPAVDVLSPTGARHVVTVADVRSVLVGALTEPVRWSETLVAAAARWPTARWWECGPSYSLHRFVWKNGLELDWESVSDDC